jgi:hypothetical protein
VQKYLEHFGVTEEAKAIAKSGITSQREWRQKRWTLKEE